ncbi:MAG TPA: hypothetical protein VGF56_00940 [Rhizomicrobium sp.]|jgi:hypothetical protein
MPTLMIVHIAAGCLGILSGLGAVSVRKGERLHRIFGTLFVLAMLATTSLAIYLAAFVPAVDPRHSAPPRASMAIAALTFYLVISAWLTVRRSARLEKLAFALALGLVAVLATFGTQAALHPTGGFNPPQPYFVFASLAAFSGALDLRVILKGGLAGAARIRRHLWRMCVALFFASAFFFIGQQKVMPTAWHGSPVLIALGVWPLFVMAFWLVRVRRSAGWDRYAASSDPTDRT